MLENRGGGQRSPAAPNPATRGLGGGQDRGKRGSGAGGPGARPWLRPWWPEAAWPRRRAAVSGGGRGGAAARLEGGPGVGEKG